MNLSRETSLHSCSEGLVKCKNIYIECTHTYYSDINTGIQRVVRNVVKNAIDAAGDYVKVVPIILDRTQFRTIDPEILFRDKQQTKRDRTQRPGGSVSTTGSLALIGAVGRYFVSVFTAVLAPFPKDLYRYIRHVIAAVLPFAAVRQFLWAHPSEFGLTRLLYTPIAIVRKLRASNPAKTLAKHGADDESLVLRNGIRQDGNILLLLDSSWSTPLWEETLQFKREGGTVIGVIYDLIPVTHPHACVPELTRAFTEWLTKYCQISDGTIAISNTVRGQFEMYNALCGRSKWSGDNAPLRYFHLGSELDLAQQAQLASARIDSILGHRLPTFLMVGSIEPRKNHAFVLEAFEQLWAEGKQARLVIVGRQAWRTEAFLERVAHHDELNSRLFVLRDASDSELEQCYKRSAALIIASEIEGFGLPIVEAFQRGLPVLCSDIPVFREVAEDAALYFKLDEPRQLSGVIESFMNAETSIAAPSQRRWLTWRESTNQLLKAIDGIVNALNKPTL